MKFSNVQLLKTADGSYTLLQQDLMQTYHSVNGALQEAKHVFLETGLMYLLWMNEMTEVSILEVGFGTGLNFLVTADYCEQHNLKLNYVGVEAYPVKPEIIQQIEFDKQISNQHLWQSYVNNYQQLITGNSIRISDFVTLQMEQKKVMEAQPNTHFDIIYYDAFAPLIQPEMWSAETIAYVTSFLKPGGLFVTYSITGNLKRILKSLGFTIEKPKGAAGKREMLRAKKS
ncbi:tRNA (5-methylaminomethyl-2-thiouridine)(34)-methyltransferase MnmD [Solitalea sp. MAHUQ-68]|uniref:tRNA (5-methylaminomethyl-2-thiouridine)(34)-methyltransferase MnmD n=1 Tax=Solitalea agri TaxID=2953739 RepID=A0A9X2F185_9SPHI|nr:tRNA (5-methylaminomethyl-2-thiouridine)(34)-methyltransferase MnmD [Solitalea agri]MCO4292205.1 tRNA (5-methylaminomethyl-2-thiouridine)(34)-methyltransferase MnmD [Solitalea agri]